MKWITRYHVQVERVACPMWMRKFMDREAEFYVAPAEKVQVDATRLDAIPFDVSNVELGHHGKECSFEAIVRKYSLTNNPALHMLALIMNGTYADKSLHHQPESPALNEVAASF